ncbi:MAG: SoxR reducing system RseC family protein [Spirochaetales bacterium]|nr:SoxR reducing system RseC family protein [Spirochaetales bacterium]
MYTVAQVKGILSDGTVEMGCLTDACQGCKAEMFCNNKGLTEYPALNPHKVELKKGDLAELYLPPGKTVLSTALVFALPLILFPIGYLVLRFAAGLDELYCALGGFAAMAIAFGIASAVTVRHKKGLMPVITKVVAPAEVSPDPGPDTSV